MKRKWICLAGAALSVLLLLGGCGKKQTGAVKRIQEAGVLNIAVCNADHKSKTLEEKEESILNQIDSLLGVEGNVAFADTPADALEKVSSGEADIAIGAMTAEVLESSDEQKALSTTDSYMQSRLMVVTRRGDYSDCEAAFEDRTLAVSTELVNDRISYISAGVSDGSFSQSSVEDVKNSLLSGGVDGFICTRGEAEALLDGCGGKLQAQVLSNQEPQQYVAVVAAGDSQFLNGINQVLSSIDSSSEEGSNQ